MAENKSKSSRSVISGKSKHSSISESLSVIMMNKRAKAEAAKARLQFSVQEVNLRKQQAEIDASLYLLKAQKEVAETEAEMKIYENSSLVDSQHNIDLPVEPSSERTGNYVEQHSPLLQSMVTLDACFDSTGNECSINNTQNQSNLPYSSSPVRENIKLNPQVPPFIPVSQNQASFSPSVTTEFTKFLLKKDLLLNRLTAFTDKPETFAMWKASFKDIINDLGVTPSEELDLLIKWLGPESERHAISLRAANVNNPINGLRRIWERLEQRYGCPEMVESALKAKLNSFPKLTNKDNKKLYELCDIVCEIDSFKTDPKYQTLLGYYDSSSGLLPIVNKLPYSLQEKWTSHAANYKKRHQVAFPPFSVFCAFLNEISQVRNDPSFMYDHPAPSHNTREKTISSQNYHKTNYSSKKTDFDQNETKVTKKSKCPLHRSNHSLNECRGFRSMPIQKRKDFLKENNICFKCCASTNHGSRQCTETLSCSECGSDKHTTALHIYGGQNTPPIQQVPQTQDGGEKFSNNTSNVNLKCTRICGKKFAGKSCSKTVLTNVYPAGHPDKSVKAYVILDDQSNVTLAKSAFFELFNENSENCQYSISSCAGYTQTTGRRATNYVIESIDGSSQVNVSSVIECDQIPNNREEIPTPKVASAYLHLQALTNQLPEVDPDADILILVGRDIPEAHHVLEQRTGPLNSPFAQRLHLGWVIIGETCLGKVHKPDHASVHKTYILQDGRSSLLQPCRNNFSVSYSDCKPLLPQTLYVDTIGLNVFQTTKDDNKKGMSMEDREFLRLMDETMYKSPEGNWVAPLPFKSPRQRLPNNKAQAIKRANILHKSMSNPRKKQHFLEFMENIFSNNHAELAPPLSDDEECWYLPFFGVYHPHKPNQIRGVFDSSAKHHGVALNDILLKGPDLTNNLLGVLMRFRREPIAVTADIQSMFHCFVVREDHRNFLRFLWYANNDPENELVEYRMRVHVFGNRPSPAVATYGLRKSATFSQEKYGKDVVDFVERDFYVDDALSSLSTAELAIDLLQRTQRSLKTGGNLRLHKISSNCPEVMKAFPVEDHSKDLKDLNFEEDDLPLQRSLGMSWNLQEDAFTFQVTSEQKPFTRRGLLSVVSSLFDPIGFTAPVVIQGKVLLRELMTETTGWDEPLSPERQCEWEEWKSSLKALENIKIPRTYSPTSLQQVHTTETLVFSDASEKIIGAVAYIVTKDKDGYVNTRFILGKAKVAPSHGHTIPRLELCAAVLAVEIAETVSDQLDIPLDTIRFFTDSKVVLGYLYNQSRRFYVYVANRIERIRKSSNPLQWQYIPSSHNPADIATRPIHANDLQTSSWLHGPSKIPESNCLLNESYLLTDPDTDTEVRPVVTTKLTTVGKANGISTHRFSRFSTWKKLVQAIAMLQHITTSFKQKKSCKGWHQCPDIKSVDAFLLAERFILREVQRELYSDELECLSTGKPLSKTSPIVTLDPFVSDDGLLRVGGRTRRAEISYEAKHPIILSAKHHVSTLLVRLHHEKVKHQGRSFTEGAVRFAGLWITGGKRLISSIIHRCVQCRRQRGQTSHQKMSDLPIDRLTPAPPFSFVGVDAFGPWPVVTRRTRGGSSTSKRWAIMFTCLSSRAIHIEVVEEMTSSCFINALRRFEAIRGRVTQYRSDRGTNFIGAIDDLQIDAVKVEEGPLKDHLRDNATTWIFNAPHSSHMGGSWERMIGVTRRILNVMLSEIPSRNLTHEVLVTFMYEVCAIVNNRPLVPVSTDPESCFPLTPNTLLTQKTGSSSRPPFDGDITDLYKAQWKRVQILAESFWKKWRQEYLQSLQTRRKWQQDQPNLTEGDIVILKEKDTNRNEWPLGLISKVLPGEDQKVRKVIVRVFKEGKAVIFVRPISDIVVLVPKE